MKTWTAWTEEQIQYLEKHYWMESAEQIGKKLGKTRYSVWKQASRMGLNKNERGEET